MLRFPLHQQQIRNKSRGSGSAQVLLSKVSKLQNEGNRDPESTGRAECGKESAAASFLAKDNVAYLLSICDPSKSVPDAQDVNLVLLSHRRPLLVMIPECLQDRI
jgi:hypothetical protein